MNPILFLSLVIILTAALPWWPYSAYGRSRHHRPWDWLLHTPSPEDVMHYGYGKSYQARPPDLARKALFSAACV